MIDFTKAAIAQRKHGCYKSAVIKSRSWSTIKFPQITLCRPLNIVEQIVSKEPQHSKIIGGLLDPKAVHGYGNIFLQLFFDTVLNDPEFIFDDKDKWIVTVEEGRYDIRIRNHNNQKIIIIENKSNWAEDQPNQLYRYWFNGIYLTQINYTDFKVAVYGKILYLAPNVDKRPDQQTMVRPDDYDTGAPDSIETLGVVKTVYFLDEIQKWLQVCMKTVDHQSDMYYYLKQYSDFWSTAMQSEITSQVQGLFSGKEQWDAFLTLAPKVETIKADWLKRLKAPLNAYFGVENTVDGWEFYSADDDYRWYLKDYGKGSLCLSLWRGNPNCIDFTLWVNPEQFKVEEIARMLRERKYKPVISAFERLDWLLEDPASGYMLIEQSNFSFGDPNDGRIDLDKLAWYANYKTDEFVTQIARKVDRFRKDEKITELLREINAAAQKKDGQ